MWVLVSPQGRSTGAPLVAAFPFCSTKSLPVRMTSVWKLCLIILLCATSQNAQHSQDLMIIGSSGHRERSETLVRVDTSVPDPREMAQCTTHQLQDTERPSPPPPRRLMVFKLVRACALVWARPVVMWNPLEVASTQDGRSIDKAAGEVRQKQGKKWEAFYLLTVLYSPWGLCKANWNRVENWWRCLTLLLYFWAMACKIVFWNGKTIENSLLCNQKHVKIEALFLSTKIQEIMLFESNIMSLKMVIHLHIYIPNPPMKVFQLTLTHALQWLPTAT